MLYNTLPQKTKRVFISFSIKDVRFRDFLVGQSRNKQSPFKFIDMSVKNPWNTDWRIKCRAKIKGCDGMIVLLSKNTVKSSGALFEIKCAIEEKIPIMGVHIYKDDRAVPLVMAGKKKILWGWDSIANFINLL
jgi:hypothetical protein